MTITERRVWATGQGYWQQYIDLNGYSCDTSAKGLKALARKTGVSKIKLIEAIRLFLDN